MTVLFFFVSINFKGTFIENRNQIRFVDEKLFYPRFDLKGILLCFEFRFFDEKSFYLGFDFTGISSYFEVFRIILVLDGVQRF